MTEAADVRSGTRLPVERGRVPNVLPVRNLLSMTKAIALALASSLFAVPIGCATTSNATEQTTTPKTGPLGRAEQFAGTALTAAKSFLAQEPPQQQPDKQAAAQAGVAAANTQAKQQQGSALSQLEQQALLDWVKSRI